MALEHLIKEFNKDNSETLTKVLKGLDPTFKAVEAVRILLPKLSINNLDKVKEIEKEMLSHYGILVDWYNRIESLKKNKENAYIQYIRQETEKKEGKFVVAVAEREAALAVAHERRVRDHIVGKLEFALEAIRTCRNLVNEKQYPSQSSLTTQQ